MFENQLIEKLKDKELSKFRNKKVGIVMQDFGLIDEYTAYQNVMIPLLFSDIKKASQRKQMTSRALELTGIPQLAKQKTSTMSGGQKQRVAISRAIVNNPDLILADEPTGALDTKTSAEIIELLKNLNKSGRTIIIVTHDPLVAKACSRVLKMEDGKIIEI